MVLKRIAVQAMFSLASVNLCGTLCPKVVRFTVHHWMPVRLLIGWYICEAGEKRNSFTIYKDVEVLV